MTERKNYLTQPRIFLLFCLLSFIYFWKPLLTRQPFYGEDFLWQFLPMNYVALQLLHSGQLPLWNPYMMSGMPLFASLSFPLFYPGTILFLFLSQQQSTMILYWFQITLAGYFSYRFSLLSQDKSESSPSSDSLRHAPAILSGICFMFAGNVITLIYPGHTMKLIAATFIPIAMFGIAKAFQSKSYRWFLVTSLILSLQIFTLHFQVCYYTWILVALYSLAKISPMISRHFQATRLHNRTHSVVETYSPSSAGNFLLYLLLMAILLIGLTAVQWLPFAEYARWCTRSGGLDVHAATEASYPPEELLSMMLVSPFGDQIHPIGDPSENWQFDIQNSYIGHFLFPAGLQPYYGRFDSARTLSEYLGAIPFLLAAFGIALSRRKNTRFFLGILFLSAILSLGKFLPGYSMLLHIIPGLNMFRVPAEILLLFSFALAVLAGKGLDEILQLNPASQKVWKRLLFDYALLSVVFLILYGALRYSHLGYFHFLTVLLRWALISFACLFLLKYISTHKWVLSFLFSLLFLDLWSAHQPYLQTMPIDDYYRAMRGEPGMQFLKNDRSDFRILPVGPQDMVNNKWLFSDIQSVWGYQSFPLRHYAEFWSTLGFSNPTLLKMTNVKYIVSSEELKGSQLKLVYNNGKNIYEDENHYPRYWLVEEKNCIVQKDDQKILSTLTSANFDPLHSLILDKAISKSNRPFPSSLPSGSVRSLLWSPQKIVANITADDPTFLVFSEIYYPGWKVFVDGKVSQIYRADYILRAVHIDEGLHHIEMYYSPWTFWLGLWISGFTSVLMVFLIIRSRTKKSNGS